MIIITTYLAVRALRFSDHFRMAKLIDDIKEDTVDATRRIVKIAEETNKIGVTAIETLDKQGSL